MPTLIRPERSTDSDAIFRLTKIAFANHPFGEQTEHFIINALREAGALMLSLVAEADSGEIVGHVAFSPVTISDGTPDWYGLGPVAVLPPCQKQGIGQSLIREGLSRLKARGAKGCVLLGSAAYYSRFGFASNPRLTLNGVPPEHFLALPFGESDAQGSVSFHEAFFAHYDETQRE